MMPAEMEKRVNFTACQRDFLFFISAYVLPTMGALLGHSTAVAHKGLPAHRAAVENIALNKTAKKGSYVLQTD